MRAMVLAAGLGTRMRPLTNDTPKPLIEVGGKKLIDWSLDALAKAGIRDVVINISYLANQIENHLRSRCDLNITLSQEESPLETGGGIRKALQYLGEKPFIVMNSDAFYIDGASAISNLSSAKSDKKTLLLLQKTQQTVGYHGVGDFFCDASGSIKRRGDHETAPYVFTGIQRIDPSIFNGIEETKFSMNLLYDQDRKADGSLPHVEGLVHEGTWLHVGTPEEKAQAEAYLAKKEVG